MSEPAKPGICASGEKKHRLFWVGLIVALLAGQIMLMLVAVYLATTDPSFAIEPDYYQKGLRWDTVAAQARRNERLGWSVRIELGPDVTVRGERALICSLADREGRPLDGATVVVEAFSHARGNERTAVALLPAGRGRYEAPVRFARQGLWEFRLAIQRGSDTFTYTEQRELWSPGSGS